MFTRLGSKNLSEFGKYKTGLKKFLPSGCELKIAHAVKLLKRGKPIFRTTNLGQFWEHKQRNQLRQANSTFNLWISTDASNQNSTKKKNPDAGLMSTSARGRLGARIIMSIRLRLGRAVKASGNIHSSSPSLTRSGKKFPSIISKWTFNVLNGNEINWKTLQPSRDV